MQNSEVKLRQQEVEDGLSGNVHFKSQSNTAPGFKAFELQPAPIMSLYNRQGVNTGSGEVAFSTDSNSIVLSNKNLIGLNIVNGHQRFLIGHEHRVSCFSVVPNENLLVSADEGDQPEIIVWRIVPARIVCRFKADMKMVRVMDTCKFAKDEK
jgi:WD40 repeat protein